jgi:Flp pilus assembly pilin Flp
MFIVPDLVRKFNDFLKDETTAAAVEYVALSAGIAVAVLTAMKPANFSPACRNCGRPLRFVRAISKFRLHPELRIYECGQCRETVLEEWRPLENAIKQLPNSRQGARTVTAALMFLCKSGGMSNLDVAIMFGLWAGSIVFGWKQQPHWLVVLMVVCAPYIAFLICRDHAWAAKGVSLARRKIFERRRLRLKNRWMLRYVEESLSLFWAAAGKAAANSKAAITFRIITSPFMLFLTNLPRALRLKLTSSRVDLKQTASAPQAVQHSQIGKLQEGLPSFLPSCTDGLHVCCWPGPLADIP